MKKYLMLSGICVLVFTAACNNDSNKEKAHQHEDGTTHVHADTVKPSQQEFVVGDTLQKDTAAHIHAKGERDTAEHTHGNGKKHKH